VDARADAPCLATSISLIPIVHTRAAKIYSLISHQRRPAICLAGVTSAPPLWCHSLHTRRETLVPPKAWKTLSSRPIYENNWMSVREDVAELPSGHTTIYGVATFGECVGVVPFIDDDHLLLVRQYRYVQGEDFRWEIPTGGVHAGESLDAATQRELQEEIGYRAGRLTWLNTYYTSKSVCDETAYLYLGEELERSPLPPDETELIEIAPFPFADALEMVLRGDIRDSMSVIGILCAARLRGV
jgi:ADP-ribose pyrophosphatase